MNSKHASVLILILGFGAIVLAAQKDSWPPCCSSELFFDYVDNNASSWDDYNSMLTRFTKQIVRKDNNGPLASLNDADLHLVASCTVTEMINELKTQCPSFKEYVSYRYSTSSAFQRDASIQKPCAVATAKSVAFGTIYRQTCLRRLNK